jgi:hypothetical protein
MRISEVIEVISFLGTHGIIAEADKGTVTVTRDSICEAIPEQGEEEAYAQILDMLKERFSGMRFYWNMKTDEYLFLDTLEPVSGA